MYSARDTGDQHIALGTGTVTHANNVTTFTLSWYAKPSYGTVLDNDVTVTIGNRARNMYQTLLFDTNYQVIGI